MKKKFTIYFVFISLFFTSCARAYYKEPATEREVAAHNVNNIFN